MNNKIMTELNQSFLGMNMEIYLLLMDDIDYLVNELGETRETLYKLILSLSYYGRLYYNDNERHLLMDTFELIIISNVIHINKYNLKKAFTIMAEETLNAEFILID